MLAQPERLDTCTSDNIAQQHNDAEKIRMNMSTAKSGRYDDFRRIPAGIVCVTKILCHAR